MSGSSAEERSLIHQKCIRNDTGAWYESELVTTDLSEACLVFVSIGHGIQRTTDCFTQISSLPSWNTFGEQGRNHVIWSASDDGIDAETRKKYFGFAAFAQAHDDYLRHVPAMDVAISLRAGGKGSDSKVVKELSKSLSKFSAQNRKWLLTFKGTGSNEVREFARRFHNVSERICILNLPLSCSNRLSNRDLTYCKIREREYHRFSYDDLFNTTFGLVIPGRSPATFRLHEILATGCIPVFYAFDDYPLPYEDIIPWGDFSIVAPRKVDFQHVLIPLLNRLKKSPRLLSMQQSVKKYNELYFSQGYEQSKLAVMEIFRQRFEMRTSSRDYRVIRNGCSGKQVREDTPPFESGPDLKIWYLVAFLITTLSLFYFVKSMSVGGNHLQKSMTPRTSEC